MLLIKVNVFGGILSVCGPSEILHSVGLNLYLQQKVDGIWHSMAGHGVWNSIIIIPYLHVAANQINPCSHLIISNEHLLLQSHFTLLHWFETSQSFGIAKNQIFLNLFWDIDRCLERLRANCSASGLHALMSIGIDKQTKWWRNVKMLWKGYGDHCRMSWLYRH